MVSKEGAPVKLQRKPFTECFYTMAFAELAKATGNGHYMVRDGSIIFTLRENLTGTGRTDVRPVDTVDHGRQLITGWFIPY